MSDDRSKRIAKNAGYLYLRLFLTMVVGLFTSRIVLKTLGFEDYGVYNVVSSIVVFFSFLKHALRNATSRFITYEIGSGNQAKLKRIYSMAINSHILLSLIILLILETGGFWFLNHKLNIADEKMWAANWAFQFSLINFCVSIIQTPWESNIIAHERFDFYALMSIIQAIANIIAACLLVLSPIDKLITYALLLSVNVIVVFSCYFIYCLKQFTDATYIKVWDLLIIKHFCSYSGWSLLVNMACGLSHQSISIFFNQFLGAVANAGLGVCNQVVSQLNAFVNSFTQAFNPQIIKSYAAGDKIYFFKLIFSASKISFVLMLFFSIPVCVNIKTILYVWLGEYPELAPSLICVTVVYYLIEALQAPLVHAVHANGYIKVHQIWVASFNILSVPIMYYVLYAGMHAKVVIMVWTLSNFASAVFRTIYLKTLMGFPILRYLKEVILKVFLLLLLSFPIPYLLSTIIENKWISFFSSCIVSVIIIATLGLFFLDKNERNLLNRIPVFVKIFKFIGWH